MAEAEYKLNMHAHVAGLRRLSARANAGPAMSSAATRKVSFSFSGYGSNVIEHLRKCGVHIDKGLTDEEFEWIEAMFQFTFPPDLRGILREGLPIGAGFPDWRSGGSQQLKMWISKPRTGILADVEMGAFWLKHWGSRPADAEQATRIARRQLRKAPVLIPVYGHCYVAASPVRAGNPVFFVDGRDVYCCGLDVSDFFHRESFVSACFGSSSSIFVPQPIFLHEHGRKGSRRLVTKCSIDLADQKGEEEAEFLSLYDEEEDTEAWVSCNGGNRTLSLRRINEAETWGRSLDAIARHCCERKSNDSATSVLSARSSSECSSCDDSTPRSAQSHHTREASISVQSGAARRIEFWSDLSDKGDTMNIAMPPKLHFDEIDPEFIQFDAMGCHHQYNVKKTDDAASLVNDTVKDMTSRLRRGGWKEDDIAEIVDAGSSCSDHKKGLPDRQTVLEGLAFHLDCLSASLRKAGWSVHDVAETLCFDFIVSEQQRRRPRVKVSPEVVARIGMLATFVAQG